VQVASSRPTRRLCSFFTLIYVAVVLKGSRNLEPKDYVTLRCIAIVELIFIKARLAAAHGFQLASGDDGQVVQEIAL
jgi:hypothetical protein